MEEHLIPIQKIFSHFSTCKYEIHKKSVAVEQETITIDFDYLILTWSNQINLMFYCTSNKLQYGIVDKRIIIQPINK